MTEREQIYPACLPTKERSETVDCANDGHQCSVAVNSGWSKPLPTTFLQNHASNFLDGYDDFYKQYQFQMEVWKKCNQDENTKIARPMGNTFVTNYDITFPDQYRPYDVGYPTNTYYPQGKGIR